LSIYDDTKQQNIDSTIQIYTINQNYIVLINTFNIPMD